MKYIWVCLLLALFNGLSWAEETTTTTTDECKLGTDQYCGMCVSDKCAMCYESYALDDGKCKAVEDKKEYCLTYKSATECSGCKSSYKVSSGACVAETIEKCFSSNSDGECNHCDGLRNKDDKKKCDGTACTVANCQSCIMESDKEVCSLCASGYVMKQDKSCTAMESALDGCSSTGTSDKCGSCAYGYYVSTKPDVDLVCKKSEKYESVSVLKIAFAAVLSLIVF